MPAFLHDEAPPETRADGPADLLKTLSDEELAAVPDFTPEQIRAVWDESERLLRQAWLHRPTLPGHYR